MCGRFTLRTAAAQVARHFGLQRPLPLELRYNIAPTQSVAVVRLCPETAQREMVSMRWGLVPRWSAGPDAVPVVFNARSETVKQQKMFSDSFARRRCLIPADGFYEWRRTRGSKQPYLIELDQGELFALAGLWDQWQPAPDKPPLLSCTVLTVPAKGVVARLHKRMPLVLPPQKYQQWLEAPAEELDRLGELLVQGVPASRWQARPVSQAVNSSSHEGPELLQGPQAPFLPGLEL